MGLFDKKYCDICGEKIGLLGNRKLEDGNLCKNCAGKLSPWFTERRHSSLADIKSQLDDRAQNQQRVASFAPTKKLGKGFQQLAIDEARGNFAICTESDLKGGNPDILSLSCIRDVTTKEEEHLTERKYKDKDGKLVSYNPPQYDYSYDFYCTVVVNHPYIDDMRFRLNGSTVKQGNGVLAGSLDHQVREYTHLCDEIKATLLNRGTVANAAPAAAAAAALGSQFVQLPKISVPARYQEPDKGINLYVTLTTEGVASYQVTDAARFNASTAFVEPMLDATVKAFFAKLDTMNISGNTLLTDPAKIASLFDQELKTCGIGNNLGVQFVSSALTYQFSDADRQMISNIHAQYEMAMDPAMAAAATVARMDAAMKAASEDWVCPGCTAKNHGGKFCEYCGTARE